MSKEYYKILPDNIGEYSVVDENNIMIITELDYKIHAETIAEELNTLRNELEYWKSIALHEKELTLPPDKECENYEPIGGKPLILKDLYDYAVIDEFTDYELYANIDNTIYPLRLTEEDPNNEHLIVHERFIPRDERPAKKIRG